VVFVARKDNVKEATVFAVGGAALGGVVAASVGGMGLAVGGTAIAITAAPVMVAGTIVGLAGYAIKNVLSN
jgi:integral membrane sensor domain MASE1